MLLFGQIQYLKPSYLESTHCSEIHVYGNILMIKQYFEISYEFYSQVVRRSVCVLYASGLLCKFMLSVHFNPVLHLDSASTV